MRKLSTLFLIVITMLFLTGVGFGQTSKQVIGSCPQMDGGFEAQAAGATTSVSSISAGGTSAIWGTATAGTASLQASPTRSGSMSIHITGGSTKNLYSPTNPTYNVTASTPYIMQFYYRTAGSTGTGATMRFGISNAGTGSIQYIPSGTPYTTLAGTSGAWVKYTVSITTNSTSPNSPVAVIRTNATPTEALDVDDICIYPGSSADVTAAGVVTSPGTVVASATSLSVSWTAPTGGVDGGGYVVMRGTGDTSCTPNANGIYAINNTVNTGWTVAYVGTGTSFTDASLTSGTTYYYRIFTCDKAFNYSSAVNTSGTPTAATPSVSLGAISAVGIGTIAQATNSNILTNFSLAVTTAAATLNSVGFRNSGTYTGSDLTNLKLWYSASNSFGSATAIKTLTSLSNASPQSFSGLSQAISAGSTGYFWITADIPGGATIGHTITAADIATTDLGFSTAVSASGSVSASGAQTVSAGTSGVTLSGISTVGAGNIYQSSSSNIVYNFQLAVATVATTLTQVTIPTSGNYVSGDLTNLKLWYAATNSFGSATAIKTISSAGAGTETFSGLSQGIGIGSTGYFWVTADVSGSPTNGHTLTVTPALAFSNLTFGNTTSNTVGSISAGGTQTINAYPTIALSAISAVGVGNIAQATNSNILTNFSLAVSVSNATLNAVSFRNSGTYTGSDLTNLKLWYSSTNSFGSATAIKTLTSLSNTSPQSFSGLSQSINSGNTGYFWITADLPGNATLGHTITAADIATTDLTFSSTVNSSGSVSASGAQTVSAGTSGITLNGISTVGAGNIYAASTNNILYNFQLAVATVATTLTQVVIPTTGSYVAGDFSNLKLWYSSSNTFGSASSIASISAAGSGSETFSGLSQSIGIGATGYFWVTADVAAAPTNGATITVTPALAFSNLTFGNSISSSVGTINAGGMQTINSTPTITLADNANGQTGIASIAQATTGNVLYTFQISVASSNATLTAVSMPNSGTYASGDFSNFKLLYKATNDGPSGATTLATISNPANSATQSFTSISQAISSDATGFFWITGDVAGGATVGHSLTVSAMAHTDLTFSASVNYGTDATTAGGAKTVSAGTSAVALNSISTVSAGNIATNSTSDVIYNFSLAVTNVAGTLSAITITTSGDYTSSDLTNLKLWYNSSNTFGSASAISTITPAGATTESFASLSQSIGIGATGYFWITADVASGATAGHTIAVSAMTGSNVSFSGSATVTPGTVNAGGTQTVVASSNASDYFRSAGTGNWGSNSTWESSPSGTDGTWISATTTPTDASASILIRSPHVVTVAASVQADDMTIESGAQVVISPTQTLTIANGAATTDLTVSGTLKNSGTLTMTGTGTVNGTYEHNIDVLAIPTLTWGTGSTLYITGLVTASSSGSKIANAGNVYNLTYNCTNQAATSGGYISLGDQAISIANNLTVQSTGGSNFLIAAGTQNTVQVSGNYLQTGGSVFMTRSGGGTRGLTVLGSFSVNGGTFDLAAVGGSSVYTLSVAGAISIGSGGTMLATSSSGTSIINMNGSSAQTITNGGVFTPANITLQVNNAGGVLLGSALTVPKLNLMSGNLNPNGNVLTLSTGATVNRGNGALLSAPTWAGTLASLTYSNTSDISTSYEMMTPATALVIAGSGKVTLNSPLSITNLTLTSGSLDISSNTLTIAASSAITRSGGSISAGTPTFSGAATTVTYANTTDITAGAELPATVGTLTTAGGTGTVTINADLAINTALSVGGGNLTLAAGKTITHAGTSPGTISKTMTVYGTLKRTATGAFTTTGATITFASGSVYENAVNGGTIITATWDPNSLLKITGSTTSGPSGAQAFGNVTWDCPLQSQAVGLGGNLSGAWTGIFRIHNSNGNEVRLANAQAPSISCVGLQIDSTAAKLSFNSGAGSAAVTVNGDVNIVGTLMSSSSGSPTLAVTGNWTNTGTFTAGALAVTFSGTGDQTMTNAAGETFKTITINKASGKFILAGNMAVTTTGTLTAGTLSCGSYNITGAGSMTVSSGATLEIGSANGISNTAGTGNIQTTTKNFNAAANYTYNGAVGQYTGNALPTSLTGNLVLNNSNGVTLTSPTSTTGVVTFTNGQLNIGSNNLTMNGVVSAAAGTISGSSSSTVSIGGSGAAILPAGSYYNLTLNRSSGALINGAASIAGTLTLTSGVLDQNSNTLTINSGASVLYNGGSVTPTLSVPATLTNYTPPAGASINSTTVNGTVTLSNGPLTVASGQTLTLGASGSIGTESAGHYVVGKVQANPVAINASTATNIAGLGVTIAAGSNNLGNTTIVRTSGSDGYVNQGDGSINRRWKITPSTQPATAVSVTLSWVSDDDNGKNLASLAVWKSENDGATWAKVAGGLNGTSRSVTFSTSSFSDFTLLGDNEVLPVELSALSASTNGRNVLVEWTTATEVNSYKFVVERCKAGSDRWVQLGEVMASKYSNSPKNYSLVDKNLNCGKYSYRLQLVDNDGSYEYSQITAEADIAVPTAFSLSQNYPNPFNPTTKVTYALPSDSHVVIELYSISGQKIATLFNDNAEAGYYDLPVNMSKYGLASGAYIYRFAGRELNSGKQFISVKKMMFLK